MKKSFFFRSFFPLLLLLSVFGALIHFGALQESYGAMEGEPAFRTPDEILQSIYVSEKVKNAQKLLDLYAKNPGNGEEWRVMSLRNSQEGLNYTAYREALEKKTAEENVTNPVTGLKEALTLSAVGSDSEFLHTAIDRFTDETRINALIYSLFLLENGAESELYTEESLAEAILSLRHEDGGWSVTGDYGDVDVTAMVLQSLAPCVRNHPEKYENVINDALRFLSESQLPDGGFLSMGAENPESAAQVAVALCGLQIDPLASPEFIKDGHTLFDAMQAYQTAEGLYSHVSGAPANVMTTSQVLYASVSMARFQAGDGPFFLFGPLSESTGRSGSTLSAKFLLSIAICVLCALFTAIELFVRKKKLTACVVPVAVSIAAILLINFVRIQSVESFYQSPDEGNGPKIETVISIRCDSVAGRESWIPADGTILSEITVPVSEGSTAYTQLSKAARENGLLLSVNGGSYIEGINNLAELQFGALSGWIFKVNGTVSDRGLREVVLAPGDRVEWVYSLDMGKNQEEQ